MNFSRGLKDILIRDATRKFLILLTIFCSIATLPAVAASWVGVFIFLPSASLDIDSVVATPGGLAAWIKWDCSEEAKAKYQLDYDYSEERIEFRYTRQMRTLNFTTFSKSGNVLSESSTPKAPLEEIAPGTFQEELFVTVTHLVKEHLVHAIKP